MNISKGNNTIDIVFFSLLYVLHYDPNVRNAEQDNRGADFDHFSDEQISRMPGHPLQTTLLTHLDHSHFCPKRGVPQTSIVISCQFVNISKGNNTIDIAFFSFRYVLSLPMPKFDNFGSQPFLS